MNKKTLKSEEGNEEVVVTESMIEPRSIIREYGIDVNKLFMPLSILLSSALISGALVYTHIRNNSFAAAKVPAPVTAPSPAPAPTDAPVKVDIGDSPILGNPKAPVTIIEFGDFQCPFCKKYFDQNQSQVVKDYVSSGKANFVWKDYAFLGDESTWAAIAARCANDQGKFWEYHDYLYSHQGGENRGDFSKDKLKGFAQALGLNRTQFNSCLDSNKYADAVLNETKYGTSVGVTGTPATFVNGTLISGSVPYSTLKAAIEKALTEK